MTAKRTVMTDKWDGCDNKGDSDDSLPVIWVTAMTVQWMVMIASNNQLLTSVYYCKIDLRKRMASSLPQFRLRSVPVILLKTLTECSIVYNTIIVQLSLPSPGL